MNYLGHLYLAEDNPASLVGNFLGDFVKGAIRTDLPDEIRYGIALHRKVDVFTDSHEVFRASLRRITTTRRRFAGIMMDMFYDHFLAKNWQQFSQIPLQQFSENVYVALLEHHALLPDRLKRMLPYLIEENWLVSYREIASIDRALNRLSKRFKRENTLLNSAEELEANYQELEGDFYRFFPDLIQFVQQQRSER
jgi:acyl carrier protein phosphodiesterase